MRNRMHRLAAVWIPLDDVRISKRRARSVRAATVELYQVWLEPGGEAPPVHLARNGDGYIVRDGTASRQRSRQDTARSSRRSKG